VNAGVAGQQPYYDNGMVNAFYGGTSDQALRPFLGNPSAPLTQVGIYAADACGGFGVGCGQPATTLLSLNAINATGAETVVTSKDVRYIANTPTANVVFNTPFGNVGRNSARDAWTNIGNVQFFKTVKVKENFKVQFHMSMLNVFNHPNFSSVDPFLDDAGLSSEGTGFGVPAVTSGGLQNGTVGNPGRKISFGLKLLW
jgi:hypothetical protein